jgi:nucleoside-diphosphate-sugar epimerase
MNCIVTGVAGFIGSALARRLIEMGHSVLGIDCLLENLYSNEYKIKNLNGLVKNKSFTFCKVDLRDPNLRIDLEEIDIIFHLAAMAGLKTTWSDFKVYQDCNILATNNLLQLIKNNGSTKFVYSSTSSVYGKIASGDENSRPRPCSPYGVTKLAAENLIESYNIDSTILRFFSVYGPRQRPDMAYSKIISQVYEGKTVEIFGDGNQIRSNTFITDLVDALILTGFNRAPSRIYNVAGREKISLNHALKKITDLLGKNALIRYSEAREGDQIMTSGDSSMIAKELGWTPQINFDLGIKLQVEHFLNTNKFDT